MFGTQNEVSKVTACLKLFKVYDITNAYVSDVKPIYRILGEHQWNIHKSTLIQEVHHARPNLLYFLDNLIPFSDVVDYLGDRSKPIGNKYSVQLSVLSFKK